MTMKAVAILLSLAAALTAAAIADAASPIRIGINSQQYGQHAAGARAQITARNVSLPLSTTRAPTPARVRRSHPVATSRTIGGATAEPLPSYPSVDATSPFLQNPQPFGPSSFWYRAGGYACIYSPGSSPLCYRVVRGAAPVRPVSPQALAASVARRVDLLPGTIQTSPARAGLTGADSWLWLDPAPRRQALSISLAGETVSVVADPTVEWGFGDGVSFDGGAGVPYQPGAAPADAIRHVYQTRCLPGDQGRDPYVLASCGQDGYSVDALVVWRISYSAAGPVGGSGTLPTRTTESSASYPVSESRAFLVSGGGQ